MKVESNKTTAFDSITITITIESKQELCNLWLRTSLDSQEVMDVMGDVLVLGADSSDFKLLAELDEHVEQLNLKQ